MKVLICGGLGNYSVRITEQLAKAYEVSVFELKETKPDFPCHCITGDVLDVGSVLRACEGHDAIITFVAGNLEVSVNGIRNILEGAEKTGVDHVVYTSSGGTSYPIPVYDDHHKYNSAFCDDDFWETFFPIYETFGLFPGLETSGYFFHKWLCEQVCERYSRNGLSVTAIRPGNLMWDDMTAPGSDNEKVVNPLHLLINGHATVTDAARLYSLALQNKPTKYEAYQLGNDTPYCNLSMEKAQKELSFESADPQVYLDFYQRQSWTEPYKNALDVGIPQSVLQRMEAFKGMTAAD
jgi:nucleoside-diphosphate-sugar epimerase